MGHSTRLPGAPLQAQLRLRRLESNLSWEELADELDISWRTLIRLMQMQNISEIVAGRMAAKLGLHESLLWPEADRLSDMPITPRDDAPDPLVISGLT